MRWTRPRAWPSPDTGRGMRHNRRMSARAFLCCLLLLLPPALAAQDEAGDTVASYVPATGDAWVDRQLADINDYAERYPDSFLDEVSRYAGVHRDYVAALLHEHGWSAGDIYFACFWGKVTGLGCREPVRARAQHPDEGWEAVVARLPVAPENLKWRALRHAIVASYDHWERPVQLDAMLRRQLGDREQRRKAAAAARAGQ